MFAELKLLPARPARDLGFACLCGLAFGVGMALADATLFRAAVPPSQATLIHGTNALMRVLVYAPRVLGDEVLYRLVVMSALVWLLLKVSARQWGYWLAIALTALVAYPLGHLAYLASLAPGAPTVMRELVEHGGAGMLWGWLYWRRGWLAGLAGHIAAHAALEPMLALLG